jgi:hypothetical protein
MPGLDRSDSTGRPDRNTEENRPLPADASVADPTDEAGDPSPPETGGGPGGRPKRPRWRLSDVLRTIVDEGDSPNITVGDLLRQLDGRAFGALMLIFAFPNILPSPPGLAGVLGLPLIYLSSQMMLGRMPWLPPFIDNRSLSRDSFRALIDRAHPILSRVEKPLNQRLAPLTSQPAERLLGALCLLLSLLLSLPIPFGNLMPALAICVIALGILERDGYWIILGLAVSAAAFLWVGGLAYALVKSVVFLVLNAF